MNHVAPRIGKVEPPAPSPCAACPWRTANHGKRHPNGWYTVANRARLWAQLRRGEHMTCHPTDPANPVPEGHAAAPEGAVTHECAGAAILAQLEIEKLSAFIRAAEAEGKKDGYRRYARANPRGLTREGVLGFLNQAIFGGAFGGQPLPQVDLSQPVSAGLKSRSATP